jgi:putative glycosyltransferase (TIGR04372 family)
LADRRWQVSRQLQYDRLKLRFFPKRYFWSIGDLGVLDTYLKSQILGLTCRYTNLILGAPEEFSNPAYVRYWQKYYAVITNARTISALAPLSDFLQESRTMVRLSVGFQSFAAFGPAVQLRWEAEGRGPLLELSAEHRDRGYRLLCELGVPEGAWFVGLHVREHDAKDQIPLIRNADIATYRVAVEEIAKRGGWVLRMGNSSLSPLPPWPNAIDYAHSGKRADWMDVFLWAEGRFFIGTGSGPQMIPMTFGKPVAIANFGPIATILCGKDDILLPKQYWHDKEGRYLTIAERLAPDHGNREPTEIFAALGIRVIDNTPEELRELVIEMMDRLEDRYVTTEQEKILQARFAEAAAAERVYPVKIARAFLSRHPDLF